MSLNAWTLDCPWCDWSLYVNARGGPYGAGEEAAERGRQHAESHGRTWSEFLKAPPLPEEETPDD